MQTPPLFLTINVLLHRTTQKNVTIIFVVTFFSKRKMPLPICSKGVSINIKNLISQASNKCGMIELNFLNYRCFNCRQGHSYPKMKCTQICLKSGGGSQSDLPPPRGGGLMPGGLG